MATGYGKLFDFVLDDDLQALGWSVFPDDYCWLACDRIGYSRERGGYKIVLCKEHIRELESTAYCGYSAADPPNGSPLAPSVYNDPGSKKYKRWQDKYWWPWRIEG